MSTQTSSHHQSSEVSAAPAPEHEWRGVAADDLGEELTHATTVRLADRSRRLLKDLLAPYRRAIQVLVLVVVVENVARLSIPYLVKEGIDRGIPPIRATGDNGPLLWIVGMVLVATLVQAIARNRFLVSSGRIG